MNKPTQLIFPFQVDQKATFESFFTTPDNSVLMNRLSEIVESKKANELMINGAEGSGKSFLMQAICNELNIFGKQFAFIPMHKAIKMGVGIFQNLASLDAVCIDDAQVILSKEDWERAMFNLINECQQSSCTLILSFNGFKSLEKITYLPDLLSRIKRMEFMNLYPVQDEFLNEALRFVSNHLNINIQETELEFILNHHVRKFSLLVKNIVALDEQAGSLKRKITIPLIKDTLNL